MIGTCFLTPISHNRYERIEAANISLMLRTKGALSRPILLI
jgi:hypothetical protein